MVLRSLKQKSYPNLPPEGRSILINHYSDGMTQFVCHTPEQVDMVNRKFTATGNMPVGYEEFDSGEDIKYILTFIIMDDNEPLLRN